MNPNDARYPRWRVVTQRGLRTTWFTRRRKP